jgi:hypothetical protein
LLDQLFFEGGFGLGGSGHRAAGRGCNRNGQRPGKLRFILPPLPI